MGGGGGGAAKAEPAKPAAFMTRQASMKEGPKLGDLVKQNKEQITEKAEQTQKSLHDAVLSSRIEDHVNTLKKQNSMGPGRGSVRKSTIDTAPNLAALMKNVPQ